MDAKLYSKTHLQTTFSLLSQNVQNVQTGPKYFVP